MKPLRAFLILSIIGLLFIKIVFWVLPAPAISSLSSESSTSVHADSSDELLFAIYYLYRSGGAGEIHLLTEESVLHSGDHFKIVFTPLEDCYVYIIAIDSQNAVVSLFPMEHFGEVIVNNLNPVKGGQMYYLPAPKKAFVLGKETGRERIYFLASRTRDIEIETLCQQIMKAQQERKVDQQLSQVDRLLDLMSEKQAGALTIDSVEQAQPAWDTDDPPFATLQRRLELCAQCVYVIQFEHRE